MLKKKSLANFQRIIELFTQTIVTKLSKVWVWDPGSEIRDPEKRIPDPGVKKALRNTASKNIKHKPFTVRIYRVLYYLVNPHEGPKTFSKTSVADSG